MNGHDEKDSLIVSIEGGADMKKTKKKKHDHEESFCDVKIVAFISIGVLTMVYVIAELFIALKFHSLVLLSDGFHNLSDGISLYIAYWAQQAKKRDLTDEMSYGWVRSEILGALTNACFLLSLCLYVVLESIPKFVNPEPLEDPGLWFIIIAAAGLGVNITGTIVFALTGQGHSHSHGHSHGGHGHAHGHDHKEKKDKKKKNVEKPVDITSTMSSADLTELVESNIVMSSHSHSHSHGHDEEEGHSHSHAHSHKEKKEKKEKKEGHGHSHDHGHSHGHKEKKDKEGHSHDHAHKDKKKKKKAPRDENVHAVFLHFLGDAISSLMVLGAGVLMKYFQGKWTAYIDPVSSLIVVALILWTTVPLVKRCCMVLLQSTPTHIQPDAIRSSILKVEGVVSVHDLHIWQLVDGMVITSVHIAVEEGVDFTNIVTDVKRVFHEYGIHSSAIQPEFVPRNYNSSVYCEQNCLPECEEDWCCKKPAEKRKKLESAYSLHTDI